LNNRCQSIGPKPDSRPRLEGARYKYLTSCSCLLTPLTLQSRINSHTSLTRLLPSWVNAMGLLQKAPAYGSRVGWTLARRIHTYIQMFVLGDIFFKVELPFKPPEIMHLPSSCLNMQTALCALLKQMWYNKTGQ